MTLTEAEKVLHEGWRLDRRATSADRARARETIAKVRGWQYVWRRYGTLWAAAA